jgi:two-component sensor histidine kinase
LKPAFPGGPRRIVVRLEPLGGPLPPAGVRQRVGFAPDRDPHHDDTLGLRLVHALAEQLDGSARMMRCPGTRFEVTLRDHKT